MARPIDRQDVDRLVVEHLPAALRFALRLCGDQHVAEDVVQEAMCRVLRQWRAFRGASSFKTWFLQIVLNAGRDRRRRMRVVEPLDDGALPGSTPTPVELAAVAELGQELRIAINHLPERQREVALLAWGETLDVDEIAMVLGVSEANVYTNLHLARKRIADAIGVDSMGRKRI
jgi:RNA polymerase sigma-70 factor (ECF subfamily)